MRTVLATSFTPTLDSGRAQRTYGIARALCAHGPVELAYGAFGADCPDPAFEALPALTLHRVERPGTLRRAPAYLRARLGGVPEEFARGIWPDLCTRAERLAEAGEGPARVIAEGPVAAAGLLPLTARRPVVYSAQNLESSFRHRLDGTRMSAAALERFERMLLRRFAESWMVSPAEMEGAAELEPEARLRLVPNVVDVAAIEPAPPRAGQRAVLFLADLGYEPNQGALRFLIEVAMPAVWRTQPDLRLLVAGKGSEGVAADPRVEGRGFVADLGALYAEAGCVAVPLLEGGGSPLKFVEALAYAMPVVATPRAAAGLAVEAGRDYLRAEAEAEPFAAALVAALEPARGNALGGAARELAEREYSIEALAGRLAP